MIRIAICDDEKTILDEISGYIKNYSEKETSDNLEIFCFDSALELLNALEDGKSFDIFVLDVYIGDEMGTSLARNIRKLGIEKPIIFATTSVEHAPQGYETAALRYLIKPINPQKLYEALGAAIAIAEKMSNRLLKFKTENGVETIHVNHIVCTEAHAHYQHIALRDGAKIRVRMTVTELFATLSRFTGFLRIGSAYIINLRHVKNVSSTDVCLYNNVKIQVPRGKYTEIKEAFWNFQYEEQED